MPALLLSGCVGESKEEPEAKTSTDLPTGKVEVPDGLTLTKAGTSLSFRQSAVVTYEADSERHSALSLTVDSVTTGRISDLSSYQVDERTKRSRPYYVRVQVKNVGTGDLSRTAVPLLAVNEGNALVQPSTFNNTFSPCPSTVLPAGFGAGKSYQGCLVYLIPEGGTLEQMSYRPLQAFDPIAWKGAVAPPRDAKRTNSKNDTKPGKGAKKKAKP